MYVQHIVGYEILFAGQAVKEGISNIGILQTLFGVPVMLLVGVLSDRLKTRKIFVVLSVVLVAIGMGLLTMNLGWTALVVVCVAIGVGFRVFYGLGAALMSEILPSASDRGKDLGVVNIASTIPQIVLPGVGAAVIYTWGLTTATGYQVLFGGGLVLSLLGAVLLQSMRGVR
jgi:MFS family permease